MKRTKKTSTSNNISSIDLETHIQIEGINKEIEALIDKHAQGRKNVSAYGGELKSNKGFFLMFVKRDMDASEDQQLQITTFGQFIKMQEVGMAMERVMSDMMVEQMKPTPTA